MGVLVAALLFAAPVQAVVLDTRGGEGTAALVTEEIARALPSDAFKVTTAAQLSAVLGLERQKQLLGCNEEGSCVAELANALGAEIVVQSTLAKVGDGWRCNVVFIGGHDGTSLKRVTVDASNERALLGQLHDEVGAAAADVFVKQRPGSRIQPGQPGVRRYAWMPAAGALLLLALGGAMFGVSAGSWGTLTTHDPIAPNDARDLASRGATTDALGVTFLAVGGVALAAAALTFALGAPSEPHVVVGPVVGAGAGGVSISGVFP